MADENEVEEEDEGPDYIDVFLSPYHSIPYLIKDDNGVKIQIKKLQNLSRSD